MYLDYGATTPLTNEVKNTIIKILDDYGNPSSTYEMGHFTRVYVEKSRQTVAEFIGANADEIYFTSSGSASNTLAIKGLTSENPSLNQYRVYYSPTAHKSMILACQSCLHSEELKVDKNGIISVENLVNSIKKKHKFSKLKPLVCIEAANSEIGTIQLIRAIAFVVHQLGGLIVVDCTGYIPYCQVNVKDIDADIITFSGHKLNALKGVGVLYKKPNITLKPLVYGSQEDGLFAGTENVLGIVSLGESLKHYKYDIPKIWDQVYLYTIHKIPTCKLLGSIKYRLPCNLCLYIAGIDAKMLVNYLDESCDIQISTGSACNNGTNRMSNTLKAIGLTQQEANCCIRITFSKNESYESMVSAIDTIADAVTVLRAY